MFGPWAPKKENTSKNKHAEPTKLGHLLSFIHNIQNNESSRHTARSQ